MKYKDAHAFRVALETRLRQQSVESGIPLMRLRKMVAFERFLSRLMTDQPGRWVLKGGLALQLRLGERARTTQDVDLLLQEPADDLHALLVQAAFHDLKDGFVFEIQRPSQHPRRFTVHCLLAGRRFESFHVDVGTEDILTAPPETLTPPALLTFAGIAPVPILTYPVAQQVAEKVHAYTYPRPAPSRVKDWVDLVLLATLGEILADDLGQALQTTFARRNSHPLPKEIPPPPAGWWASSRRLRQECGLTYASLDEMHHAVEAFLNPVLRGQVRGHRWIPGQWQWVKSGA